MSGKVQNKPLKSSNFANQQAFLSTDQNNYFLFDPLLPKNIPLNCEITTPNPSNTLNHMQQKKTYLDELINKVTDYSKTHFIDQNTIIEKFTKIPSNLFNNNEKILLNKSFQLFSEYYRNKNDGNSLKFLNSAKNILQDLSNTNISSLPPITTDDTPSLGQNQSKYFIFVEQKNQKPFNSIPIQQSPQKFFSSTSQTLNNSKLTGNSQSFSNNNNSPTKKRRLNNIDPNNTSKKPKKPHIQYPIEQQCAEMSSEQLSYMRERLKQIWNL